MTASPERRGPTPVLALVLLSPLAVFLALAAFSYPSLDDWHFAAIARRDGVVGGTLDHLRGWGGRFTVIPANLLLHSLPYPALVFPAAIAGNLLALVVAWRLLLPGGLARPWWWAAAAAGLTASTLPRQAEGLYWMCGMLAYVAPFTLVALLVGVLRHLPESRWSPPLLVCGGTALAGCGETVVALGGVTACGLWALGLRQARWLALGLLLGFALSMAAPGTWVRLRSSDGPALHDGTWTEALSRSWTLNWQLALGLVRGPMPFALLAAAVLGSRCGSRMPARLPLLAVPVMALGGTAALLPSMLALGSAEGRQQDAVWLLLLSWALASAWWLGARYPRWPGAPQAAPGTAPAPAGRGLMAGAAAAALLSMADGPPQQDGPALAAYLLGVLVLLLGVWRLRAAASIWLLGGLATLALWLSPPLQTGCLDLLVRAPLRRHDQGLRDAGVRALAAQGVLRIRVPYPEPRFHPTTISVGDLSTAGCWWNRSYAQVHGVAEVGADPRCVAAEPMPATGP